MYHHFMNFSTKFPDINKADPKKKAPAIRSWDAVSQRILGILQRYSKRVLQESGEWKKYFTSCKPYSYLVQWFSIGILHTTVISNPMV